jgi:hypothetical protein
VVDKSRARVAAKAAAQPVVKVAKAVAASRNLAADKPKVRVVAKAAVQPVVKAAKAVVANKAVEQLLGPAVEQLAGLAVEQLAVRQTVRVVRVRPSNP